MRVIYHEISGGEHSTNWPDGRKPTKAVKFLGKMFDLAGIADGATHYRERG